MSSITPTKQITHYILESPGLLAQQNSRRALMWNIAAKVSWIGLAVIAMTATVLTMLGSSSVSIMISMFVAIPILMFANQHCVGRASDARAIVAIEQGVTTHLKEISHWGLSEIQHFCKKQRLMGVDYGTNLLPLIARFLFWKEKAEQTGAEAMNLLQDLSLKQKHTTAQLEEEFQSNCDIDRVNYWMRKEGSDLLEKKTFPALLNSALMLELIAHPWQECSLRDLGYCYPKPLAQRLSEKIFDRTDLYFEFKDSTRPCITTKDLMDYLRNIPALHQRMFGDDKHLSKSRLIFK